jgi:hypothetical protein
VTEAVPYFISDCDTDPQRARWLLRSPLKRLVLDHEEIRHCLRAVHFTAGLAEFENILAVLADDRREDGRLQRSMLFGTANGSLVRIAEGLPPVGL